MTQSAPARAMTGTSLSRESSVWPLLVLVASVLVGLALLYWSRSDDRFAGPFLGGSIAAAVLLVLLWAVESVRTSRCRGRNATVTQSAEFALLPGRLPAAQGKNGLLAKIRQLDDEFYGLDGFEHLRIVVTEQAEGLTRVAVETTWRAKTGAMAEASRRVTALLAAHAADIEGEAGEAPVRESEVVFDSAEEGFSLSLAAFSGIVALFTLGGLFVGMMTDVGTGGGSTGTAVVETPAPTGPPAIIATDNKFNLKTLTAKAGEAYTVTLTNNGKIPHNLAFLDRKGGAALAAGSQGEIVPGGGSLTLTFTPPAAGTYYFQCDLHPDQMNGTFTVE